jgi:hypothetical protein
MPHSIRLRGRGWSCFAFQKVAGFDALNFDNSWLVLSDHRHPTVALGVLFVGVLDIVTLSRVYLAHLKRQAEREKREAKARGTAA